MKVRIQRHLNQISKGLKIYGREMNSGSSSVRNCAFNICLEGLILIVKSSVAIRIEYLKSAVIIFHRRIPMHCKQISEFERCRSIGSKNASWKNPIFASHLGRSYVAI